MNPLLKRQLRKYLPDELKNHPGLITLLEVVNSSYNNYDDQFLMLQRAMKISSDELFEANKQLKADALQQEDNIVQLKNVINTLRDENSNKFSIGEYGDKDIEKLIDLMGSKTQEIVKINKEREELLKELAYQNMELSDYAHMVSHDLKSPLRSIDALSSWLVEDYESVLGTEGKNNLELIRSNVAKMDSLISGILEYSTVSKNSQLRYAVDLDLLLTELLEMLSLPKNCTINCIDNLPIVHGDKHRLQQLFQNLIVNAIQNNDKENIQIDIGCKEEEGIYQFYVKDNGKGIAPEYLEKVFKTFFKLENKQNSIGIGLAIVKKIVELYGGEIWVESVLEKETVFNFTLKK